MKYISGVLWPLNGQPEWLLFLVKLLPQTQAIHAIRCIVLKGIDFSNEQVYMSLIVPLIWIVIFILLSIIMNKIDY